MKLGHEEHMAIAQKVAGLLRENEAAAFPLHRAVAYAGFKNTRTFHRWARLNGVKSMRGAKGTFSKAALDYGIARSSNISGRHR